MSTEPEEKDDSEMWAEHKEERKQKRWSNDANSTRILREQQIPFRVLNASLSHYRVGDYDFWATTGKFYNPKTGEKGRGVFNLIKRYEQTKK